MNALVQLKTGPCITQEFASARLSALMALSEIEQVTNDEEAKKAADAQLKAQELMRAVERTRKELKRPLIDAGKAIEDAAEAAVADLKCELGRIMPMQGNYAQEVKEREREAIRRQQAELDRIEREKQAALREAAMAEQRERDRIEAEKRAALAAAKSEADKIAAELEAEQAAKEAAERTKQAAEKAAEIAKQEAKLVPQIESTRPAGQQARDDWEITITNIHELFRFHPGLCKIEPLTSEIKAFLDRGIKVHGITAKPIVRVTQRSTKQRTFEA